jgi:Transposase IS116/IS110/IS902 family
MAPVVEAYQAMRGVSFLVAATVAAEIGDVRRFDTPRRLMAFLGLVPVERSTGEAVRRKGLTLAGNRRARRALIEAALSKRKSTRDRREDFDAPEWEKRHEKLFSLVRSNPLKSHDSDERIQGNPRESNRRCRRLSRRNGRHPRKPKRARDQDRPHKYLIVVNMPASRW